MLQFETETRLVALCFSKQTFCKYFCRNVSKVSLVRNDSLVQHKHVRIKFTQQWKLIENVSNWISLKWTRVHRLCVSFIWIPQCLRMLSEVELITKQSRNDQTWQDMFVSQSTCLFDIISKFVVDFSCKVAFNLDILYFANILIKIEPTNYFIIWYLIIPLCESGNDTRCSVVLSLKLSNKTHWVK